MSSVDSCVRDVGFEAPEGFSIGPNGSLVLIIDDNDNTAINPSCHGRVVEIDPVAFAVTTYANPGPYVGAAVCNAGIYDPVIDAVLVHHTTGSSVMPNVSAALRRVLPTITSPKHLLSALQISRTTCGQAADNYDSNLGTPYRVNRKSLHRSAAICWNRPWLREFLSRPSPRPLRRCIGFGQAAVN